MEVSLYHNSSENNAINKRITLKSTVSAILKAPASVEDPIIILDYAGILLDANYVYIPEFSRYYFIEESKTLTGGRIEMQLSVDVLMSFSSQIMTTPVIIDKQEQLSMVNKYFNDGSYLATQKEFVRIKEFATGFNDAGTYILITCGG